MMKRYVTALAVLVLMLSGCTGADAPGKDRDGIGKESVICADKNSFAEKAARGGTEMVFPTAVEETVFFRGDGSEAGEESEATDAQEDDGGRQEDDGGRREDDGGRQKDDGGRQEDDGGRQERGGEGRENKGEGAAVPAAHECSWDEGIPLQESSCIEEGIFSFTCVICGGNRTERTALSNHCLTSELRVVCGEQPVLRQYCVSCGEVIAEEIVEQEVIAHSWERKIVFGYSEADCLHGTQYYDKCTRCGAMTDSRREEPLGHVHGPEPERLEDAGCLAFTQAVYRCIRCGEEMYEDTSECGAHRWETVTSSPWNPERQDWETVTETRCRVCAARKE